MKTKQYTVAGRAILAALVATAAIGSADAQTIAEYLFTGGSNASTGPLGSPISFGAGIVNAAGSTPLFNNDRLEIQGADTLGGPVGASTYAGAEATWISRNSWVIFTVDAPPTGQKIDLTSLNFDYTEIQPGDFLLGVYTSKTGFTAGSQLVGFFRDGNSSSTFTTRNGTSINLTGVPELQNITDAVEFRFLVGDDSGATSRIHVLDNIVLNGNVAPIPDPGFGVDMVNTDEINYDFGNVFGNESRKVTFVCQSPSGLGTVNIDNISITNDAGGLFTLGSVTWSDTANQPLLSAGDSVTIEVIANNSQIGTFAGQLTIDTTSAGGSSGPDANDLVLSLNSTTIANQALLNANPLMTGSLSGWLGNAAFVTPGIAPGSPGMARVRGKGDPAGTVQGSLYQTAVPNGFSDFQFIAYFTPIDVANFVKYADPEGVLNITGPDGNFTDRTFQWVLLGSDANPPNPVFDDAQAANTLINLAYLPDGDSKGGTPDFYVFDAVADSWVATGIGAIAGSVDHDSDGNALNGVGDGLLNTAVNPLDVINVYKLVVTGTGLGTPSASYNVAVTKVSGPDTFTAGSASGLNAFHGLDGTANTATGHAFITSDTSDSNSLDGFKTPFWVDDAAIYNGTAPDPSLTVLSTPGFILVNPPATTGTTSFMIRNDGTATNLDVTSLTTGTSGFTVTSASSFSLAPSATAQIDVLWNSANSAYTANYETATLTINSSSQPPVVLNLGAGVLVNYPQALSNGSFETPGTDNVGDTDTFADWDEITNPASITDVPGLIAPSITAAAFAPATSGAARLAQNVTSPGLVNFTLNFDFSVAKLARDLTLYLQTTGSLARANIAYNSTANSFIAFNGTDGAGGGAFVNVLPFTLTANTPYKLRITGTNWGYANPSYTIDLFDSAGSPLGTSGPLSLFQYTQTRGTLAQVAFSTEFGGSGGMTIDEVFLSGAAIDTTPPLVVDLLLTNPVFVSGSPNQVFANVIGGTVDIYRSTTLMPGSWTGPIVSGLAPGTGLVIDPNANLPKAFYIGVEAGGAAP